MCNIAIKFAERHNMDRSSGGLRDFVFHKFGKLSV